MRAGGNCPLKHSNEYEGGYVRVEWSPDKIQKATSGAALAHF